MILSAPFRLGNFELLARYILPLTIQALFLMMKRMDSNIRLTKAYLDTLATSELARLADSLGIDIPPDLDRIFIIEELLELDLEYGSSMEDLLLGEGSVPGPVPLPKHYNITYVDVLLRDPAWAFVFWEINSHDRDHYEQSSGFDGYQLRVCPLETCQASLSRPEEFSGEGEESFTVPVGISDMAWYLNIPPGTGWYRVEVCAVQNKALVPAASSAPFRVPRFEDPFSVSDRKSRMYALISLSGLEDSRILYNADRISRLSRPQRY
jgi:hypothetical protein